MKKIFYFIIVVFVLFFIFRFVSYRKKLNNKKESGFSGSREVNLLEVKRGDVLKTLPVLGEVFGNPQVKVFPKVTGKLFKKNKLPGNKVRKDEIICFIDRDEPAFKFTKAELKSPIDGVVLDYFVDIGDQVTPTVPVVEVANIDYVKVFLYFSEEDSNKIKKGQEVFFKIKNRNLTGYINRVYPSLDFMSRKMKAEIIFKNKGYVLKPGMTVNVDVALKERKNVLKIPATSVYEVDGKKGVFINENGKARFKEVKFGLIGDNFVEVLSGLKEGDKIIKGVFGLKEGLKIKVVK